MAAKFNPKKVNQTQVKFVSPRYVRQEAQILSRDQMILKEMFSGEKDPIWGSGRGLPKINGELRKGGGIIKSGDVYRETAGMFGL